LKWDIGRPPGISNRLYQHRFTKTERGRYKLLLPLYYSALFRHYHSKLLASPTPIPCQPGDRSMEELDLGEISAPDRARVREFLETYQQTIMLGPSSFIRRNFDAELDAALALDFNYLDHDHRTGLGQLEFRAKWQQSEDASHILAGHLAGAIGRLPLHHSKDRACLTYPPQYQMDHFHLPRRLATDVCDLLESGGSGGRSWQLVDSTLIRSKERLKELPLENKLACWEQLINVGAIVLAKSVADRVVYIVDDLYQSGVTMWSLARFLKSQGAVEVLGLTCVKSVRDTDNQ